MRVLITDSSGQIAFLHQPMDMLVPPHQNSIGIWTMTQDELITRYRAAEVLVNPPYSESFGMSLVEAMACEQPVVATRVGGTVRIIGDEQVGILVDRGDVEGLAAELVSLLTDEARRREMGAAGRQRVLDRFSWSQAARGLLREYKGLDVAA